MMEKMKNGEKVIGMQKELCHVSVRLHYQSCECIRLELATMRRNVQR